MITFYLDSSSQCPPIGHLRPQVVELLRLEHKRGTESPWFLKKPRGRVDNSCELSGQAVDTHSPDSSDDRAVRDRGILGSSNLALDQRRGATSCFLFIIVLLGYTINSLMESATQTSPSKWTSFLWRRNACQIWRMWRSPKLTCETVSM